MPVGVTGEVLAWLLTYALHSTVLLLAVALVTRRHVRAEAWRDALWKAALLGGIATASVQQLALTRMEPLGGVMSMTTRPAERRSLEERVSEPPVVAERSQIQEAASPPAIHEIDDSAPPSRSPGAARRPTRAELVVGGWLLIALMLLARLAWHHVRLFRALRGRVVLEDEAAAMLAALRRRAGVWWPVRLSVATCPTPIALGASEICVPQRFLRELDADAQRCALAHELGHLARRDPMWHLIAGVIESVFFFQPLNRLARVRLREAAEHLADDWAVRHTGSALGLARCLSEVATWVGARGVIVPTRTMAMAEAGSPLIRRIERLLVESMSPPEPSLARRIGVAAVVMLLAAITMPAITARAIPIGISPQTNGGAGTETDTDSNSSPLDASVSTSAVQPPRMDENGFAYAEESAQGLYVDADNDIDERLAADGMQCETSTERIDMRRGEWLGVKSRVGRVRVEGWSRSYAEITVQECAGARAQLAAAHMQIVQKDGGHLIETRFAAGTNLSWDIDNPTHPSNPSVFDYTIRVPRWAQLRNIEAMGGPLYIQDIDGAVAAQAAEGPISAIDLRGPVQLNSAAGSVQLTLQQSPGGAVSLESVLGHVTLWVDANADATIRARSPRGQVRSDLELEGTQWQRATLGRGGNVITLASQQGGVDVRLDGRGQREQEWQQERIPLTAAVRARAQENALAYATDEHVRTLALLAQQEPKHDADLVAERATWALALMQNADALTPLLLAAGNDDWRVRAYAAWTLSVIAPHDAFDVLLHGAADEHWRVRMTAAYGLGAVRDARSFVALQTLLDDEHWQVRIAGVENLDKLGDPRAVPALRRLADDPHIGVRDAVRSAIARLSSVPNN